LNAVWRLRSSQSPAEADALSANQDTSGYGMADSTSTTLSMTVITFLQGSWPGTHILAVCRPCVAVLAAVAIMAED
jgi:poly-beta-hydroxyalkanoate depolymerase